MTEPKVFANVKETVAANPVGFLVSDCYKKALLFENEKHYFNWMQKKDEKHHCEILRTEKQKLYFDIDLKDYKESDDEIVHENLEKFMDTIIDHLNNRISRDLTRNDFITTDSSGYVDKEKTKYKFSFHVVVQRLCFSREDVRLLAKEIKKIATVFDKNIDVSVYKTGTSIQNFRLLYSSKENDSRVKYVYHDRDICYQYNENHFLRSLITYTEDCEFIEVGKMEKKKIDDTTKEKKKGKKQISIENLVDASLDNDEDDENEISLDQLTKTQNQKLNEMIITYLPGWKLSLSEKDKFCKTWYRFTRPQNQDCICPIHDKRHKAPKNDGYLIVSKALNVFFGCCKSSKDNEDEKPILLGSLDEDWIRDNFDSIDLSRESEKLIARFRKKYPDVEEAEKTQEFRDDWVNVVRKYVRFVSRAARLHIELNAVVVKSNENNLTLMKPSEFNSIHTRSYSSGYTLHPSLALSRTKNRVQKLVCIPTPEGKKETYDKTRVLNTFPGYKAKRVKQVDEKIIKPVLDHIKDTLVGSDKSEKKYNFVLDYFAWTVQNSDSPMMSLLFYDSLGRTGKSLFFEFMQTYVYGDKNSRQADFDKLCTQNTFLINQSRIFINECTVDGSMKKHMEKIKSTICDMQISIEDKYFKHINIDNHHVFVFATNNTGVYQMIVDNPPLADRFHRFCVSSTHRGDAKYFRNLSKMIKNQTCGDHFYTFLLNRNIDGFIPSERTYEQDDVEEHGDEMLPPIKQFFKNHITKGDHFYIKDKKDNNEVQRDEDFYYKEMVHKDKTYLIIENNNNLRQSFNMFARAHGLFEKNQASFLDDLRKVGFIDKKIGDMITKKRIIEKKKLDF